MRIIILAVWLIATSAAWATAVPICGETNYTYSWACEFDGSLYPYCDKLQGEINLYSRCYDGYIGSVTSWAEYKLGGVSEPWGHPDTNWNVHPYCHKLIPPIDPRAYCWSVKTESVITWDQYQGKDDPCYIAPDKLQTESLNPDCGRNP